MIDPHRPTDAVRGRQEVFAVALASGKRGLRVEAGVPASTSAEPMSQL